MTEGLDLHLGLDKGAGFVGRALETALREAIRSGRLHAGSRLPGSRSLAADLGISRGTVVQAYAQLIAEGWLTGTTGSGTRVADLPGPGPATAGDDPAPAAARLAVDLRPGRPDLSSFPRTDWASSVRRALSAAAYEDLDYAEPAGLPVLRAAVAGYVTRARGVRADAGAVVITAGFTPGLALLGRVLHRLGMRAIATEDPGLGRHRDVLHAAGLATVPLEVGPGGADPDGLAPGGPAVRAVVLTPAHQYPRGVVLGARKRSAFADWARREDGFIVEDDYDGEFRYDQQPVGAMQALAPDRIVFAGSTSKTLAPGMRLGWLVVPPGAARSADRGDGRARGGGAGGPAARDGGPDRAGRVRPAHPADAAGLSPPAGRTGPGRGSGRGGGGAARAAAGGVGGAGTGADRAGTAGRRRPARAARWGLLAGTRREPARRADHRVRHSPAARLVPGAGGAGRSGTGNLSLSGLRYWTGPRLAWWA